MDWKAGVWIIAFLLSAGAAHADEAKLAACAKFKGEITKAQCYEAVVANIGKPESSLFIMPPPPPAVPVPPTPAQICRAAYSFAMTVMAARQSGRSFPDMMEIAGDDLSFGRITKDAFSQPLFLTTTARQLQIESFGNAYYAKCLAAQESGR